MKKLLFCIGICLGCFTIKAQDVDTSEDNAVPEDLITFTYTVLPSEMTSSYFKVSHDTVTFRLVYVDIECYNYSYEFKRDGNSLIVQRVTLEMDGCNEESDQIYAFEGTFTNVPKGKSLFELESVHGDVKNSLYREVLEVK